MRPASPRHESDQSPVSTSDTMTMPEPEDAERVLRFGRNETGRDFVVGDIHGMFAHLRALLDEVSFDPGHDRLFSVGDLVDRGPGSSEALQWLECPWFHACRGNHEQFAIDSVDPQQRDIWVAYNGGEWWTELDEEDQAAFRESFLRMPLAMEVETRTGLVGIVHADVPPLMSWEQFMEMLESGDREASFYAMWSRNRIATQLDLPVTGRVDRIYCGHTPTVDMVELDNVYYIDTGACYIYEGYQNARLTLIEIQPERHRPHQISTADANPAPPS